MKEGIDFIHSSFAFKKSSFEAFKAILHPSEIAYLEAIRDPNSIGQPNTIQLDDEEEKFLEEFMESMADPNENEDFDEDDITCRNIVNGRCTIGGSCHKYHP